jgi:hypothetical protein
MVLSYFRHLSAKSQVQSQDSPLGFLVNKIALEQMYHKVCQFFPMHPRTGSVDK